MKWIVLLIFLQTFAFSQENKKDSILKLIQDSESNEYKAASYLNLAKKYKVTRIDSAIYFAKKGYETAKQDNNQKIAAESAAILGDYFIEKNLFNEAKRYYTIYTKYLKKEENILDYCKTKMIIANIELVQNNYTTALTLYYECLDIAKSNDLANVIPHLYNNLGNLYFDIEDYKDAKEYFNIAHKKFIEQEDKYNAALSLSNISNIHNKLGENEEAIRGYLKVIETFSSNGNWEDIVSTYHSLAEIYLAQNNMEKSRNI